MIDLDLIGDTPLLYVEGIYVKMECSNPGGSVKDRIARYMLLEAQKRGELKPGDTIVEATSGNTGIAMAMVGTSMGHKVVIYMPEHMSVERRRYIESFGAEVRLTPEEGGFEEPVRVRDTFQGKPGYYIPDQFGNRDNIRCHRDTTGKELIAQLAEQGCERLDWFVAGTGTGGTLMGVAEALCAVMPGVRIAAVEPTESAVMSGGEAASHGIMGIGDGFIPDLVDMSQVDEVMCVTTEEAHAAADAIRRHYGHCVGRSSGANMACARRLRDRGFTVATVWADCSDRYGSVGLPSPDSKEVTCERRARCQERMRDLLAQSPLADVQLPPPACLEHDRPDCQECRQSSCGA
jgi:cysteine synthase A